MPCFSRCLLRVLLHRELCFDSLQARLGAQRALLTAAALGALAIPSARGHLQLVLSLPGRQFFHAVQSKSRQ